MKTIYRTKTVRAMEAGDIAYLFRSNCVCKIIKLY